MFFLYFRLYFIFYFVKIEKIDINTYQYYIKYLNKIWKVIMKNTISGMNVGDLGEKLKKIIGDKPLVVEEVSLKDVKDDIPNNANVSSMGLTNFKNLMNITSQQLFGRELNIGDLAVVHAKDMVEGNIKPENVDSNETGLSSSRPKLR